MKNVISYFYNMNVEHIKINNNVYYFFSNGNNFVFQEVNDEFIDEEMLVNLSKSFINSSFGSFQVVNNKYNNVVTIYNDKKYVLLHDGILHDEHVDFNDILSVNIVPFFEVNDFQIKWNALWKDKIDYFELYVRNNYLKYSNVAIYFDYFLGLAENAVSYLEDTIKDGRIENVDKKVICHKRITTISTMRELYNPLNFVVDHPVRDVALYLKLLFFQDRIIDIDFDEILSKVNLSVYGARLLFSRMLFPSFFFDAFEKINDGNVSSEVIIKLVDKMSDYESFLEEVWSKLNERYSIPRIMWIKKVDYSSTFTTPNTSGISFTSIDSMPSFNVTSIMLQ